MLKPIEDEAKILFMECLNLGIKIIFFPNDPSHQQLQTSKHYN